MCPSVYATGSHEMPSDLVSSTRTDRTISKGRGREDKEASVRSSCTGAFCAQRPLWSYCEAQCVPSAKGRGSAESGVVCAVPRSRVGVLPGHGGTPRVPPLESVRHTKCATARGGPRTRRATEGAEGTEGGWRCCCGGRQRGRRLFRHTDRYSFADKGMPHRRVQRCAQHRRAQGSNPDRHTAAPESKSLQVRRRGDSAPPSPACARGTAAPKADTKRAPVHYRRAQGRYQARLCHAAGTWSWFTASVRKGTSSCCGWDARSGSGISNPRARASRFT